MKRVLTAAVLVPVVLLIVLWAPLWLYTLVIAGIIALALHEYLNITEAAGIKPFRWLTYVAALLPIAHTLYAILASRLYRNGRYWFYPLGDTLRVDWPLMAAMTPVIFGVLLVFRKDLRGGLASAAASVFGVFYVSATLSVLIILRAHYTLAILVIFVLFSVWAGDIAAYYIGKNFGRRKLAPIVSPNKSWEGAVASVIASVGVALLVFHYRQPLDSWFAPEDSFSFEFGNSYTPLGTVSLLHMAALGVVTNIAAQFGDLFESALKRGADIKDSGTLLPGHGGILDRIDALLFAIPVVWYYASLTNFLPTHSF